MSLKVKVNPGSREVTLKIPATELLELLTAAELNCYSDLKKSKHDEYSRGLLDFARGIRDQVTEGLHPQAKEVPLAKQTKEARWAAVRAVQKERVLLDQIIEEAIGGGEQ